MFISLICNVVVCVMLDVTLQRLAPRGKTFCALLHCVAISSSVTFSMKHKWTICLLTILVQSLIFFFLVCWLQFRCVARCVWRWRRWRWKRWVSCQSLYNPITRNVKLSTYSSLRKQFAVSEMTVLTFGSGEGASSSISPNHTLSSLILWNLLSVCCYVH